MPRVGCNKRRDIHLMEAARIHALPGEDEAFSPPIARTLDDTGLTSSMVDDMLLKRLYHGGPQKAGDVAHFLCLPFLIVLQPLN